MQFGWAALIVFGALGGASVVAAFAVPVKARPLAVLATLLFFPASAWGLAAIALASREFVATASATALGVASAAAGYALGAGLLQSLPSRRRPHVPERIWSPRDRPTVLLLADADPARYSMRDTAEAIRDLEEADATTVPLVLVPLYFAAQRARYSSLGGSSPARDAVRAIADRLAGALEAESIVSTVATHCDGDHRLVDVASEEIARGADPLVIARLGVAESRAFGEAIAETEELLGGRSGTRIVVCPVLWTSTELASLVAGRVLKASENAAATTGVVLVVHGQPPAWERGWASFDVQETSFAHRVREQLVEGGIVPSNVRVASAGWREPDVTDATRHLAALGCARVLVVPACDPVEGLDTLLDLPHAVRMARVSVPTRVLPAWGDTDQVVDAVGAAVRVALGELDERE